LYIKHVTTGVGDKYLSYIAAAPVTDAATTMGRELETLV
jgi:hypothetical protein